MSYKKPWTIEQVGPEEWLVSDADKRKLFYITADEGDDGEYEPSMLLYGDDSGDLLAEIERVITEC